MIKGGGLKWSSERYRKRQQPPVSAKVLVDPLLVLTVNGRTLLSPPFLRIIVINTVSLSMCDKLTFRGVIIVHYMATAGVTQW
jgi:hypothetical protein